VIFVTTATLVFTCMSAAHLHQPKFVTAMPDTRTSLFVVVITLLMIFPVQVINVAHLGTESTIYYG